VTDLLDGLRRVVTPDRVRDGDVILLDEKNPRSICKPVSLDYRGIRWALRVEPDDHLKLLAGARDKEHKLTSFSRLPDWIVFCEPGRKARKSHDLWVIVCELKSGGRREDSAKRQLQLGKFLVEYLVLLAAFGLGKGKERPRLDRLDIRGLLVFPRAPTEKWATGNADPYDDYAVDAASDMAIYQASDDDPVRVEDLFG
jgi:hypothetical protein